MIANHHRASQRVILKSVLRLPFWQLLIRQNDHLPFCTTRLKLQTSWIGELFDWTILTRISVTQKRTTCQKGWIILRRRWTIIWVIFEQGKGFSDKSYGANLAVRQIFFQDGESVAGDLATDAPDNGTLKLQGRDTFFFNPKHNKCCCREHWFGAQSNHWAPVREYSGPGLHFWWSLLHWHTAVELN